MRAGFVAALCAVVFAAAVGDASAFSAQVDSRALVSGQVVGSNVGCTEGAVLGGGFDPQDPGLPGFEALQSAFFLTLLGSSWRFEMHDETGLPDPHFVRGAAICGDVPELSVVTESDSYTPPIPLPASATASCPAGRVALGGGFRFADIADPYGSPSDPAQPPQSRNLLALAPVLSLPILGERALDELDEGTYGAPSAYRVEALSHSTFESTTFPFPSQDVGGSVAASVVCADLPAERILTVVSEGVAATSSVGSHTARCPGRWVAVGGGVDGASPEIVSSAPLFPGFPFPERLWDVDDGEADAPIGWRASIRNDSAIFEESFKVAVICVPEPAAAPIGLVAAGALSALARRRRR